MRLEPVYLLTPEPEPPRVSRRRAIFGGALLAIACGALGWWSGRGDGVEEVRPGQGNESTIVPAALLAWALDRLEDDEPDQLLNGSLAFLLAVREYHESCPELWDGVETIIEAELAGEMPSAENSVSDARQLLQTLQATPHPAALDRFVDELQRRSK